MDIQIASLSIDPPREGDKWFMQAVMEAGFTREEELQSINRYRCYQQVLYLSDVLEVGGKSVDRKCLTQRAKDDNWSNLTFPSEKPPVRNLHLWRQALDAIAPRGRVVQRLGSFLQEGHKRMDWFHDERANEILHMKGTQMDIYCPLLIEGYEGRPNHWSLTF